MPRMSNLPVELTKVAAAPAEDEALKSVA
jgi:hypothetical protein